LTWITIMVSAGEGTPSATLKKGHPTLARTSIPIGMDFTEARWQQMTMPERLSNASPLV